MAIERNKKPGQLIKLCSIKKEYSKYKLNPLVFSFWYKDS